MLLHIHDESTIADVQEKFNESFPLLKIEFYSRAHHYKAGSLESDVIEPFRKIGEISKKHREEPMEIMSGFTVAKVESDFKKLYGLNVQIFRKANEGWLETINTDTYTLRQQEELSANEKKSFLSEMQEPLDDYDYL